MKHKELQQRLPRRCEMGTGRRSLSPSHNGSYTQQSLETRRHDRMPGEIQMGSARRPLSPSQNGSYSQQSLETRHSDRMPSEIQLGTPRRPLSPSHNVSYSQQSFENQRRDRMPTDYPMAQVKDEMISDYAYEAVRENPCHDSSVFANDIISHEVKMEDENYFIPGRRQRQRPSWQRKESLQYEQEREKRNGYLRRRGRGLVDSASILSAKTHEEIVVIIGGQGFYFDTGGFRVPIDSETVLAKIKSTAKEHAQNARKRDFCGEHPKLPSFSLSTRKRGLAKRREEEDEKISSPSAAKRCGSPVRQKRPRMGMPPFEQSKGLMDDERSGSTAQPSIVHQKEATYESECASSFLMQLAESVYMDYSGVNAPMPSHQSNMSVPRYNGIQPRDEMNYDSDDDCEHWQSWC